LSATAENQSYPVAHQAGYFASRIARLIAEKEDKVALANSLIGILPDTAAREDAKEEKFKRYA